MVSQGLPISHPPVSLSSIQYYQLLRHTFSLPSSMWLLTNRTSPIVLPKTIYPPNTPTISLYTRISYIDFQANIIELRFHPRTINELRRAYDYFLDKSYALRMYNPELKTALRGRFLYRLESWVEKIGCEAIKAAIREDIGCGDLGAWCEGMVKWESEEVEKLKAKRGGRHGQPKGFITEGEQAVIKRYGEVLGVSFGEKKQGRKEREGSQKTKIGVVEYIKAGFVPCLEEAQDIWRMTFKVPEGWVWASYPELSPITPCLKQKFPGLCQSLGVATPTTENPAGRAPRGKIRPSLPINERLASIDKEGATASGALGKRKLREITTDGINRTTVEDWRPSSMAAYQAGTEWHPRMPGSSTPGVGVRANTEESTWTGTCSRDCSTCAATYEDEGTLASKRVRLSIDDEDEESPMDLETPRAPVPPPAEADPMQPLPSVEAMTSTSVFWPPHPHSVGQEAAPAAVLACSPTDAADTRVLTATWDQRIKVVQKQHQGLPSPRIPPLYSPLSYLKHKTRRHEERKVAALERVEDRNVCVGLRQRGREGGPIVIPSSPLLPAQKPGLYLTPPADERDERGVAARKQAISSPIMLISSSP
ncbi:hypothetical protein BGX38DRAFT_1265075 [Terfezia claveryi]|nr:hypothetical protein BGX38DRAFT_1265075 [Terfezia claveryi]